MEGNDDLIFALDIGTRTVVGALLEPQGDKLVLRNSEVIEHKDRSMLDGQIHNVMEVAKQVKEIKKRLEESSNTTLKKVGIAAAGRALKTVQGHHQLKFKTKKEIREDDVKMLEFGAVQQAQQKLASGKDREKASGYHFVGYTLLESKLDGIKVGNLLGQSGKEIEVDLIATFLPRIVVDSLLTVIRQADLEVNHLTLEPIAASNLIVPRQMYNFNLALVDIGAGTSDIAITKDGSIIAYAMVPVAGDEITEAICEHYMVDYHTAEGIKRGLTEANEVEIKNILDQKVTLSTTNVLRNIEDRIDKLAEMIADRIMELNQQKPQAIICIGGGSLTPLFKEKLSKNLELPSNRVGIKDIKDVEEVEGEIDNLSGTQAITPLGIAVSCRDNTSQANFLDVEVNGDLVHLFTLTDPKVSDALLAAEIDIKALKANPGLALSVEVNGNLKMIKGTLGESGTIIINGQEADIDSLIEHGDQIKVELGESGNEGGGVIADVVPDLPIREITINDTELELEPIYYMNGEQVTLLNELEDRAKITYEIPQTVRDIAEKVLELPLTEISKRKMKFTLNGEEHQHQYQSHQFLLNNKIVGLDAEIEDGDDLVFAQGKPKDLKIADLLEDKSSQQGLKVVFNGRSVEIPAKRFKVLKNGHQAKMDDLVSPGDEIEYKPKAIKLNQLLDHVNYQLPSSAKGKLVVQRNGKKARLTEPLEDGDKVRIGIESNSSSLGQGQKDKKIRKGSKVKREKLNLDQLRNKIKKKL